MQQAKRRRGGVIIIRDSLGCEDKHDYKKTDIWEGGGGIIMARRPGGKRKIMQLCQKINR